MFQVHYLTFKYPHNRENTIKGLSLEIKEGEIFGLLGPSGVGKSTTQKILVKLLSNYRGQIFYQGKNLKTYHRKKFYQKIGVGFEVPVHFSKLTAQENIDFFKKLYRSKADTDALMDRLGILKDRHRRVSEFSKGMKIRLNLVRALLNKPRMLFLDEPTIGLDPKNARIVKDIIREFREEGGTVLLTTHLMNDVEELCDRVGFMVDGRIEEIDTPRNLKLRHAERKVEVEYQVNDKTRKDVFDLDHLGKDKKFWDLVKNRYIITIHSKETTLDDIFIQVTGMEKDD